MISFSKEWCRCRQSTCGHAGRIPPFSQNGSLPHRGSHQRLRSILSPVESSALSCVGPMARCRRVRGVFSRLLKIASLFGRVRLARGFNLSVEQPKVSSSRRYWSSHPLRMGPCIGPSPAIRLPRMRLCMPRWVSKSGGEPRSISWLHCSARTEDCKGPPMQLQQQPRRWALSVQVPEIRRVRWPNAPWRWPRWPSRNRPSR